MHHFSTFYCNFEHSLLLRECPLLFHFCLTSLLSGCSLADNPSREPFLPPGPRYPTLCAKRTLNEFYTSTRSVCYNALQSLIYGLFHYERLRPRSMSYSQGYLQPLVHGLDPYDSNIGIMHLSVL